MFLIAIDFGLGMGYNKLRSKKVKNIDVKEVIIWNIEITMKF